MSKRLQSLIERAKSIIDEPELTSPEFFPALEIQVFDFDHCLHNNYSPLPCVQIMQEYIDANVPVYIVTARNPGQETHICDVLAHWGVAFDESDVFAIGQENPKGPVVRDLIDRHQAEKCSFWDDLIKNCESVFDTCAPCVEELNVFHLSRAIPGDIRMELRKDIDNERLEIKHSLQERRLYREWRRIGKL